MKTKIKNKHEKGITLIALVVTIVIMLILAGVTIKLAIDDNGIIGNAKEAKDQYEESQENDEKETAEFSNHLKNNLGGIRTGGSSAYDPALEGVPIPTGFVYVGGTKDSGLVISDNANDKDKYNGKITVGTDLVGNQFVWIPVEDITDYIRMVYKDDVGNFSTGIIDTITNSEKIKEYDDSDCETYFTEALPTDEKESIEKNKGYYIGRYEVGDKESTASKSLRADGASISNQITVKAGQAPYNYIKYTDAKSLAEGFSGKQGYTSVKSKLVSSYAWDTAIVFIQKTNSDYGGCSEEGNYQNSQTFTYIDIEGVSQTKANGDEVLIPTGQTTAVNNIYDMGGNVEEWSTESCYDEWNETTWYTWRGGNYSHYYTSEIYVTYPAGIRGDTYDKAFKGVGFRITLFL